MSENGSGGDEEYKRRLSHNNPAYPEWVRHVYHGRTFGRDAAQDLEILKQASVVKSGIDARKAASKRTRPGQLDYAGTKWYTLVDALENPYKYVFNEHTGHGSQCGAGARRVTPLHRRLSEVVRGMFDGWTSLHNPQIGGTEFYNNPLHVIVYDDGCVWMGSVARKAAKDEVATLQSQLLNQLLIVPDMLNCTRFMSTSYVFPWPIDIPENKLEVGVLRSAVRAYYEKVAPVLRRLRFERLFARQGLMPGWRSVAAQQDLPMLPVEEKNIGVPGAATPENVEYYYYLSTLPESQVRRTPAIHRIDVLFDGQIVWFEFHWLEPRLYLPTRVAVSRDIMADVKRREDHKTVCRFSRAELVMPLMGGMKAVEQEQAAYNSEDEKHNKPRFSIVPRAPGVPQYAGLEPAPEPATEIKQRRLAAAKEDEDNEDLIVDLEFDEPDASQQHEAKSSSSSSSASAPSSANSFENDEDWFRFTPLEKLSMDDVQVYAKDLKGLGSSADME